MELNKVIFRSEDSTRAVLTDLSDYNQSIFKTQIKTALKLIRSKSKKELPSKKENSSYDCRNNIVAFTGDRGSGKTSCMISTVKILGELAAKTLTNNPTGENFEEYSYETVDVLDPSFFSYDNNLLEVVVSMLYGRVTKNFEENTYDDNEAKISLIRAFRKVKSDLVYIKSENKIDDEDNELEALNTLSSSVRLKDSMHDLLSKYLGYFEKKNLLIPIDDMDLNTREAYNMTEQIRKYLIQPGVIILMAIKTDQLTNVVRLTFTNEYEKLLQKGRMNEFVVEEMAERYMEKFLPLESRIPLPTPESFFSSQLTMVSHDGRESIYDSVRQAVPELIFEKCRYLFYNTKGATSLIVPRNLRSLRILLQMLDDMPPYYSDHSVDFSEEKRLSNLSNKERFKAYFFKDWVSGMDKDYATIAFKLIVENDPVRFNAKIVALLKKQYSLKSQEANSEMIADDNDQPMLNSILADDNYMYNISTGDVFLLLNTLQQKYSDDNTQLLLFFIKSLYSMRLYENYDILTERGTNSISMEDTKSRPLRYDDMDGVSDYQKLIGGSFFTSNGVSYMSREKNNTQRDIRIIDSSELFSTIAKIKAEYAKDKRLSEQSCAKLRLCEYFMLSVSRYDRFRWGPNKFDPVVNFRNQRQSYYTRSFSSNVHNLVFDALVPVFNVADIHRAYNRFDTTIFGIASAEGIESLYKRLHGGHSEKEFLSMACIRNAEILDEINTKLLYNKDARRSSSDNIKKLAELYNGIANYVIKSYDKGEEGGWYNINIEPMRVLAAELNGIYNLPERDDLRKLFDNIYLSSFTVVDDDTNVLILDTNPKDDYEEYFDRYINQYKSRVKVSAITGLNKYYKDFANIVGEKAVNSAFDKRDSYRYSPAEIKNILQKLMNDHKITLVRDVDGKLQIHTEQATSAPEKPNNE